MAAQAHQSDVAHKPLPATTQVFEYVSTGVYRADILGYSITVRRLRHSQWEAIDNATKRVMGEGSTRQSAVREAFYDIVNSEEKRLEWILNEQPYRVYGTKPRRTKKEIEAANATPATKEAKTMKSLKVTTGAKPKEKSSTKPKGVKTQAKTQAKKQRCDDDDDSFEFSYNEKLGGHLWLKRGPDNKIAVAHGPFATEQEMLDDLMAFKASSVKEIDNQKTG